MRINVYSQELTDEVGAVSKEGTDGNGAPATFIGVRLYLQSAPELHNTLMDDDRSAVTFWLPRSAQRRLRLARAFRDLAELVDHEVYMGAEHDEGGEG